MRGAEKIIPVMGAEENPPPLDPKNSEFVLFPRLYHVVPRIPFQMDVFP